MPTREEVGRRIREAREEIGLSQAELGRLLTRPRSYAAVSDIERGKTRLDVEELEEMAVLLQKELAYFYETRSEPSIVYRRGDRRLTAAEQRETDRAVEAFKELARKQARQQGERTK